MTAPPDPAALDRPPPSGSLELEGLDAHQLLKIGLDTVVMPQGPDPDPDATVPAQPPSSAASNQQQPDLPLPEQLTELLPHGNYLVVGFLGQGGMGAVYQGTQVRLKRPVAIKIMRRDHGRDYDFEARFEREAQAMAKLNHPNIVSVIDFGEAGADYLYIVMELVEGADLMNVIRTGRMTQEMALSLLPQICDALQFAHDHGIVHRDIKPSNIMLTRDGRIKIADFGLAKHFDAESSFRTQAGTGMGTPDYAAPEQFNANAQIDHRADIYALGVMIYQMITGELPRGVHKAPSQCAQVDKQWDDIVSHAMQRDPADRYQQASEIKTDVSSITLSGRAADSSTGANLPRAALAEVSAPPQSSAPLIFGIIGLGAVIAFGAFFGLRPSAKWSAPSPVQSVEAPAIRREQTPNVVAFENDQGFDVIKRPSGESPETIIRDFYHAIESHDENGIAKRLSETVDYYKSGKTLKKAVMNDIIGDWKRYDEESYEISDFAKTGTSTFRFMMTYHFMQSNRPKGGKLQMEVTLSDMNDPRISALKAEVISTW